MRFKKNLFIVFILVLAFILRFAQISYVPPSLNWDEVSHGYNAYSILKTSKDEWGERFPAIFRAYGDYKLPVYIYFVSFFTAFLGPGILAVRLPSILSGTLSVLFAFLLIKELFKKEHLALMAAFLLAIEPWGFFVSRIASEANLSVFFIISGVYFFIGGLKDKDWKMVLSVTLLGSSVWTYNSARIFTPLLLLVLILIFYKKIIKFSKKQKVLSLVCSLITAFFFVPMFFQLLHPMGQARYEWVKILDQGTISQINENRVKTNLPAPFPRLIHNKATYFVKNFVNNYFSHFSPQFLFLNGGSDYQFSIPNCGVLFVVNLPFFFIGFFSLLQKLKTPNSRLILSWIFLAPLASSLTREAPHVLRTIIILPMPMFLSAFGFFVVWNWLAKKKLFKKLVLIVYGVLLLASFESYIEVYARDYRIDYSWVWQYGYEQIVEYVRPRYKDYDKIIITKKYGEPHEFFLFYWPWDPASYQTDSQLVRFNRSNWYWVDRFDKFYFVNDWQIVTKRPQEFVLESGEVVECYGFKCLLITSPANAPADWKNLEAINFLNGESAFEIYEN
jgi:4-amino-4-deoxy-L-arabinose transferase-like glycosyltransferase